MNAPRIFQARPDGLWNGDRSLVAKPDVYNSAGEFLIPGNCVLTEPPELAENQAARLVGGAWSGYDQQWEVIHDFRGLVYWDPTTHQKIVVTEAGVEPPAGYHTSDPGPVFSEAQALKLSECDLALNTVDDKSRRSLREVTLAVVAGTTPDSVAVAKLNQYNTEAAELRTKRAAIVSATTQPQLDAVVL